VAASPRSPCGGGGGDGGSATDAAYAELCTDLARCLLGMSATPAGVARLAHDGCLRFAAQALAAWLGAAQPGTDGFTARDHCVRVD